MNGADAASTQKLRDVAIIGYGNRARYTDNDLKKRHIYSHAKAISNVKQLKLTASSEINKTRLKRFAKK